MPRRDEKAQERVSQPERSRVEVKFGSLAEAQAYASWRAEVPRAVRGIVEAGLYGKEPAFTRTGLPGVDAFLSALAEGVRHPAAKKETPISYLRKIAQDEGTLDALAYLLNPKTSFTDRRNIWERHIKPVLEYYRAADLEAAEKMKREAEFENQNFEDAGAEALQENISSKQDSQGDNVPPPPNGSISPTMDEMEKGEGEPRALYRVSPFWGGYYAEERCDIWNSRNFCWESTPQSTERVSRGRIDALAARDLTGKLRAGQDLAIPLAPGWTVDPESLKLPAGISATFQRTPDGSMILRTRGEGIASYQIHIGLDLEPLTPQVPGAPVGMQEAPRLPQELDQLVRDVASSSTGSAAKARLLVKTVREHLEYSNDSSFNAQYRQDTSGYVERVWAAKKADCDVANSVALFALRAANLSARIVSGHFVKEKSKDGDAVLHDGSRHAWLEVWDDHAGRWFLADATPKGDPTLGDERPDEQSESGEGNYGEREAEIMSDEDLKKLIEELTRREKEIQEKIKTAEEETNEEFAEEAKCTPEKAAFVRDAFRRVRERKDAKNERLGEKMLREWQKLVTSRLAEREEYQGPVRRSEGDALMDPVSAYLDMTAGARDPSGYERVHHTEKREDLFGGLDIYLLLDLSGSMAEVDPVSGQVKADLQRDFALLYADTIMQCAFESRQSEADLEAPLPIRLQIVSIHGGASVDLPLTDRWGPKEQVVLYDAVHAYPTGGTPDHAGLHVIEQRILQEREVWKKKAYAAHEKPPIEFVPVCLDGGSDDLHRAHHMVNRLRSGGAIVYGYGMTAAAGPITATYAPNAKVVESLEQHAEIVAKDTIEVFKKLYPERVKEN